MGVLDASTSPPKERYAVSNDNVIKLIQPGAFDDQLTEALRTGARALLAPGRGGRGRRISWQTCRSEDH